MIDMSAQASALMAALGHNFGLDLQPDGAGACAMRIDDCMDVTLRYEPNPPALLAYAPIGELPHEGTEGVLRGLLEANHVWDGSRGATWSLSGNEVVLSRLFALEGLEVDPLAAELASFVEVAIAGLQILQKAAEAHAGVSEPAAFEASAPLASFGAPAALHSPGESPAYGAPLGFGSMQLPPGAIAP